jgi:hypothetical protein
VVILWAHCRGQASDREEKRNGLRTQENRRPENTKNITIEASMSLKTNEALRKRTQNELKLSAECAQSTHNSSFLKPHMFRPGSGRGNAAWYEAAWLAEIRRRGRKHINSGNEAKEYLKTKDFTFLHGANYARFARHSAPTGP